MQSKKFIICGVPRAGKSTLARKIAKQLGCSHIPLDPLMTTFHIRYPETGITLSMKCDTSEYFRICKITTQFLLIYIKALDRELDSYVIEGFHMDIDMIVENFGDTHTVVIVGYPHVTQEQKIRAIRRYDTSDIHWTYVLEKTELEKQIYWFIELSILFYSKAQELGAYFVDTSFDYDKVIEEFLRKMGGNVFDMWNHEKQILHSIDNEKFINEREVRFVKLGKNIGAEQNGKHQFMRPFLVVKKIGNQFFGIPLTTGGKDSKRYLKVPINSYISHSDKKNNAKFCLGHAKTLDAKRFDHKIGIITIELHVEIKKILQILYL